CRMRRETPYPAYGCLPTQIIAAFPVCKPDKLAHRANVLTRCALFLAGCGVNALSGLRVSANANNRGFPCL
ncbi:hypothetical protein, partial [Escherichia albertii]|uniref:hypothetical protein n=1 Tax=Escherichia albertii TaxID=208962 RepID=UPI001F1F0D6D